ncbi:ADC synthase [Podospora aff. communis PSN243]|uniref:aminodeoxychorismate synthase n=1 Tax=Podospora aff. communis PSN243 TaxID=3040156 RepID=A0AAV9GU71_9PEZI|nr:ADC synthase [Podospora aff. communis PSN243]
MGSLQMDERPHILYIDAFDSFANNITGLLEQRLGAQVTLVHTDNSVIDKNFLQVLRAVDAVVVGPGPGHPANPSDVGFIDKLWALDEADLLPVLGICLGFQSLCLGHGADVQRLPHPRHGIVTRVSHRNNDMFASLAKLEATQYHSLHADIGGVKEDRTVSWEPTSKCPLLQPLAWDEGDAVNGPILMGVQHTTKPFCGVQFHPESICTSAAGGQLITNWWTEARQWLHQHGRIKVDMPLTKWLPAPNHGVPLEFSASTAPRGFKLAQALRSAAGPEDVVLGWESYPAKAHLTTASILNSLGYRGEEVVVLDSQGHGQGRFDIMGLVVPGQTMKVTYSVSDRVLRYGSGATPASSISLESIDEVWPMLQEVLDLHFPRNDSASLPQDIPFWGGFMGYISYEAGLETIDVAPHTSYNIPDINFAFVHRSIVIDRHTSHVYVQSLLPDDQDWILATGNTIAAIEEAPPPPMSSLPTIATASRPSASSYRSKIQQCQAYLHSGDSYELCLTDSSAIALPSPSDPWAWYTHLRLRNPAPHGAYVHLSDVHVLSSSPERFLRWTREGICEFRPIKGTVKKVGPDGKKILRPEAEAILGTAKERAENLMIVDLIRHDLAGAVGARNVWVSQLMEVEEFATVWHLVSVIQGKLSGVNPLSRINGVNGNGVNGVNGGANHTNGANGVKHVNGVNGTNGAKGTNGTNGVNGSNGANGVHSANGTNGANGVHANGANDIEDAGDSAGTGASGIDVLRRSLPPGSMTGAPKKRSCEILNRIEGGPRGVYSGVLGYMDVGGGGDFSVIIRTAVRHSSQVQEDVGEVWRVGAGGAITVQSDEEGEFLEMELKAASVLDALFNGVKGM